MFPANISIKELSQNGNLAAGSNTFEFGPGPDLHWIVFQLVASYNDPVYASGNVLFWVERAPFGSANSFTLIKHPTDTFSVFPLIDGEASTPSAAYAIRGVRRQYIGPDDKFKIFYGAAPASRPYQIRGHVLEASKHVDLSCFLF